MANPLKMFGGGTKFGMNLLGSAASKDEVIGGVASGGLSGASTGASLGGLGGPVGAAIGAAIGAVGGSILGGTAGTQARKQRYQDEDEELEFQEQNSLLAKGDGPFDPRKRTQLTSTTSQATLLG